MRSNPSKVGLVKNSYKVEPVSANLRLFGITVERICVSFYLLAWFTAVIVWTVNWVKEGSAPSGPTYNRAKHFLDRLTPFVHHAAQEWTERAGYSLSTWFAVDIGASFTIIFAALILILGVIQWFSMGQLTEWVHRQWGRRASPALLLFYGAWAIFSLWVWLFA